MDTLIAALDMRRSAEPGEAPLPPLAGQNPPARYIRCFEAGPEVAPGFAELIAVHASSWAAICVAADHAAGTSNKLAGH